MITLYTFGPHFGLPDPSPFVTKAEILLKMAGLPYRADTGGFAKAPKGKLPYIDDDGKKVADSTFIRRHLERKYGVDFDRGLSPEQRASAWAFEKMAEDNLYWAALDSRWNDDANFARGPAVFFRKIPAPVRPSDRSTRSPTFSAQSRSSWAPSRPASMPRYSPLSPASCVPISTHPCGRRRKNMTTFGATSDA